MRLQGCNASLVRGKGGILVRLVDDLQASSIEWIAKERIGVEGKSGVAQATGERGEIRSSSGHRRVEIRSRAGLRRGEIRRSAGHRGTGAVLTAVNLLVV